MSFRDIMAQTKKVSFSTGSVAFLGLSFWLLCAAVVFSGANFGQGWVAAASVAYMGFSIFLLVVCAKEEGTAFCFLFLFMLALTLFNGGQIIAYVAANFEVSQSSVLNIYRFPPELILKIISINGLFASAFFVGAMLVPSTRIDFLARGTGSRTAERTILQFAVAGCIIAAPLWISQRISEVSTVANYGYFALYRPYEAKNEFVESSLTFFFVPCAIYWFALDKSRMRYLPFVVLIGYSILMMVIGNRRWGIMNLLAVLWVYEHCVARIDRRLLLACGLAILIVFPVIALFRSTPLSILAFSDIQSTVNNLESPFLALPNEMGGSAMVLGWSLEYVPATEGYLYGKSFLISLVAVVPNHMIAYSVASNTLSQLLVWRVNPAFANDGGGYGFSMFAELYVNFGIIGGAIASSIFGYLIQFVSRFGQRKNASLLGVAVCGVMMSFMLFYPRSDSTMIFRPLVWLVMAPILFVWLFGSFNKQGMAKRALNRLRSGGINKVYKYRPE